MNKNISSLDRTVRLAIAALFIILYATGIVTGTLGIILLVLAGVFTLTAIFSFCPIYALLGIRTLKAKK